MVVQISSHLTQPAFGSVSDQLGRKPCYSWSRRRRRLWAPLTSLEASLFLLFEPSSSRPRGKPQSRSSCTDDGGATSVATLLEGVIFGVNMVVVWVLLAAGMLVVVVRPVGVDGGFCCCCPASFVFVFVGVPWCRPCCCACSSTSLGGHCVAVSLVLLVLFWFIFALRRRKMPPQLANRFEFSWRSSQSRFVLSLVGCGCS